MTKGKHVPGANPWIRHDLVQNLAQLLCLHGRRKELLLAVLFSRRKKVVVSRCS